MTTDEILQAAVEKQTPVERDAYLDAACGADVALRALVEGLLKAHEAAGSILEQPLFECEPMAGAVAKAETSGAVIGPYKLLQQIGEGGMGTVFMAEQTEPLHRKIALKVIKAGMDSEQVIARFEAERQALAMMDHVNIARVFDGGTTENGRPYFVMELVHGVPITNYCDDNRLTPSERLELFVPVCQAIQHAHQKGIIHRDIKPSNVMVTLYDGKPVAKVIDFGVAKAIEQKLTERTLFTQYGTMVGTLEYMSPEQAEISALGVDTRSDIYSLGVLLYELLTGSTPLTHKRMKEVAYAEILRMLKEEEPPKPSTRLSDSGKALASISANRHMAPAKLTKLVRGELDWIVMKCLEKDRHRRYETANGLAMDLQRYLTDEPVLACPPLVGYRLGKFVRRNHATLVMASIVTLAVLLVVGSLGWMARDRTAREQEISRERAARQAVINERLTLALEEARQRQKEGRWRKALAAAKRAEALAATGEIDAQAQQRVREVLGDMQMLANLEDVRTESTKNESGFDLKAEDSGIARAFREYGIDIDALDRDTAAMRLRNRSIRSELAVFLDSWSHVRRRRAAQGSKQVGKDWKELLEIARAVDPDPWRDRFRRAVLNDDRKTLVEIAASAPISSLPAETVDRLGDALLGKDILKEAAAFLEKGQRHHPHDYWINVNLANCLRRLGPQHLDDAIRYYTAAVALRPEAALSHSNLGNALEAKGKLDQAIACYRKSIELSPKRSWLHSKLAAALGRQGKPDEAGSAYQEAKRLKADEGISVYRKELRLKPDNHLAHFKLGVALGKQGKLDEAIAAYRESLRLKPALLAKDIVNNLAWHFVAISEPMACNPKQAVELIEQVMAQDPTISQHPNAAVLASVLASSAPMLLLADDADSYRRLCARAIGKLGDTTDPRTAYLVARICALAPDPTPDPSKLLQLADRAVRAERVAHHLHAFGLAHYRAGQFDKAIEHLHKSIDSKWNANAANWLVLAMAHQRLGHTEEARKWLDKAVRWIDSSRNSVGNLQSIHRHDSLACAVLLREAQMLLPLQPRPAPGGETAPGTMSNH